MKRREQVILLMAAAGALYAVWTLFLAPAPGNGKGSVVLDRAGLEKTVTEVKDLVDKSKPDALESFILVRASSPLPRDPFHRTTSPGEVPSVKDNSAEVFVYSGYLEMGNERFAIINGMEYRLGEELETAGYYVAAIERHRVTIERRVPGQAASNRIVTPLNEVEDVFDKKKESNGNATAR
jgi:hypothetical protein